MATAASRRIGQAAPAEDWWSLSPEDVGARLGVDPAVGLSVERAAELLDRHGPNALPVEKPVPGWRRLAQQYRSYMQMILVGAAIVSLVIKEWSTGVLLILITVLNAVVSLRQEGKAESAMNALKAMVKATARVRREGSEAEIAAEEVVVAETYPDAEIFLTGVEAPRCLIHVPNESVDPSEIEHLAVAEALFLEKYTEAKR
jgi:Ca2+-transporting ATPase